MRVAGFLTQVIAGFLAAALAPAIQANRLSFFNNS
jgi:fructose-specific phosphotransferase system IIC component